MSSDSANKPPQTPQTKVQRFIQLLHDDELQNRQRAARQKAIQTQILSHSSSLSSSDKSSQPHTNNLKDAVDNVLRAYGVLSPLPASKTDDGGDDEKSNSGRRQQPGRWKRPVPSTLYSAPISPPQSTLVPLSSLPLVTRTRLGLSKKKSGNNNEDDDVVEVPLSALLPPSEAAESSSTGGGTGGASACTTAASATAGLTSHRPLSGNLSTKLTDYTRGVVGRRRPFRAGGMDVDENKNSQRLLGLKTGEQSLSEQEGPRAVEEFRSEEETKAAREVLDKGALASWADGTLLTAPPGVTFRIGLKPSDVYEDVMEVEKGSEAKHENEMLTEKEDDEKRQDDAGYAKYAMDTSHVNPSFEREQTMWDKSYFDDDSLFGESTSGSSSTSEEEEEPTEEVDANDEVESESSEEEDSEQSKQDIPINVAVADFGKRWASEGAKDDDVTTDIDEVDSLLHALAVGASITEKALPSKRSTTTNPLKIQQSMSSLASRPRKSWAVSTPFHIDDFNSLVPNPAITYPFELDTFQKQAILRLERSECIFVAAHTSAGKTVCAEYAIALARKHCTRAVYTSPIKALSNQKYRDFKTRFGDDVGLITGDMQINADSTCLIMTTEILRSMLYRGADLVRDIEWVIFDEVHYVNDAERGVVWEEVIIMLPSYVNLIFLSATTPNTIEFSDWIGRTKRKPVHVIRTDYRPVPLSHHLWAGLKLHKVMEGKGGFLDKGYAEAAKALLPSSEQDSDKGKGKKSGTSTGGSKQQSSTAPTRQIRGSAQSSWQVQGNKQNWTSLVKFLERECLMPTVVFSFSKKKCEEIANMLRTLDLNTAAERNAAHGFALQTMARLSPNDASLPQVLTICEMVKRGIGVHHGGLLPILKEMVEILFSRNLIKVLFATETFAMGVNMPARAVVFNSIRKHDGTQFRVLHPGEYTQMAGRAGRRGLDKIGTVIICCFGDAPPPQLVLRNMLTGSSTKLQSQFRLTYNMILNLLRVEDMSVEDMIKRSFSEFATQRALATNEYPKLLSRGLKTFAKLDEQFKMGTGSRVGAEDIEDYYAACAELLSLNREILQYILSCAGGTGGGAFVPGRIVLVTSARKHGYVRAPALILRPPALAPSSSTHASGADTASTSSFSGNKPAICIVLLPESYVPPTKDEDSSSATTRSGATFGHLNYVGTSKHRYYAIREVSLEEILLVSAKKHKIDSKLLFKDESDSLSATAVSPLNDQFSGAMPLGTRRSDGLENPFAGIVPRRKKDISSVEVGKASPGASKEAMVIDNVMSYLIEAENQEATSGLDVMDLRDCLKGVQQGNETLEFRSACGRMEMQIVTIRQFKSHYHPSVEKHYSAVERKDTLRMRVTTLQHLLSNESLQLFPDFLQRKSLLRTLGYVDENDIVCVKGRVACEVNTCEELIVTEMVFEGILNELEPAEIVAALSALIFQEKSTEDELDSEIPERLMSCCERMKKIAMNLGQMQKEHGIAIDPKEYCDNALNFGLVHVVYEWALGVPFSNICELTLVQEGSIVRCITRLDELCREVRNCARVVGNPALYRKMESASVAIKRDIVFASSLYVS